MHFREGIALAGLFETRGSAAVSQQPSKWPMHAKALTYNPGREKDSPTLVATSAFSPSVQEAQKNRNK